MHLADNIIVLTKDGHLRAQGKWNDLRSRGVLNDDFIKSRQSLDSEPSAEKVKSAPKALKGASANDIADLQRQTGDISLYLYYGKTIGSKMSSGVLASVAFCAVAQYFPRGSKIHMDRAVLIGCRNLDQMVFDGIRQWRSFILWHIHLIGNYSTWCLVHVYVVSCI